MRHPLRIGLMLLAVAAVAVAGHLNARANGGVCTALMAGFQTAKEVVPELVLFNTLGVPVTLDLVIKDADGDVLVDRADEVTVEGDQTIIVSLQEQLSRDLEKKEKPYQGLLLVELTGDAPFGPDTVILHCTQFFGNRKKPKAAFILQPRYRDDSP